MGGSVFQHHLSRRNHRLHGETSLVATCVLGFYAWGYFILLRRWQNKARSVRITLYLAGALFPLTLIWLFLANI